MSGDNPQEAGQMAPAAQECLRMLRAIASGPAMNEEARKQLFILHLRSIFPEEEYRSRFEALAAGAETRVATAPSALSGAAWGFMDTRNGELVIEFKANLLRQSAYDEAEVELKRYIAGLWTDEGFGASFCCVATDALRWHVLRPLPVTTPPDGRYTAEMVSLEVAETLDATDLTGEVAHHLVLLLKRILIDENLLPLTAENLRRDFGLGSTQYALLSSDIGKIVGQAQQTPEVRLAMDLWGEHQAYKAIVFNTDLYLKHIYLVILSRLMVAACFQDQVGATLDDDTILDILSGDFFEREIRLANFVERDFFGWIISDPWINDFLPLARQLYHNLRAYDFVHVSGENVLRLVYDDLMPAEQQTLLGLQSTPEKLVTPIVRALLGDREPGYHFLDPACGSGSFLRVALLETRARLNGRNLPAQQQLSGLITSVAGIDVDPIAVILSKTVWALTLADLLPYAAWPIHIPVYHADSLFVATDEILTAVGGEDVEGSAYVAFDKAQVQVPAELLNNIPAFDKLIEWCQHKARALADECAASGEQLGTVDPATISANLLAILGDTCSPELEAQADAMAVSAAGLVNEFASRIRDRHNGIWAFILRNSYRPSSFVGRFDLIASNPPWLAMSRLADIPYKYQLLQRAEAFDIRPGDASFLHAEIATTFLLHNVSHFLVQGGQAAFVLTRSVFDGDQHQKFRCFQFTGAIPFAITEVWDLDEVENLFKIPACVIFGSKDPSKIASPGTPIPARYWRVLEDPDSARPGSIVLAHLGAKSAWVRADAATPPAHSYGYYSDRFRQGADLMPRTALFVDLRDDLPSQTVVAVQTSEIEVANPQAKLLKDHRFRGAVNRRYLFSTVTSSVLLPFVVLLDQLPTALLPVEFRDGKIVVLTQQELIDRGDTGAAEWFASVDREIGSKKIRSRINVRGKLTQQQYADARFLVHYGAGGTYPCAGIQQLDPEADRPFIADQTTYVCALDDEDEAYYLVGMLNAPVLAQIIEPFQAKGGFGPRHIHSLPASAIPPFDSTGLAHQRVVELSRRAAAAARTALTGEMRDQTRHIGRRRALLRQAIARELDTLNEAAREVLSATPGEGVTG
jgi:hypothetical protein